MPAQAQSQLPAPKEGDYVSHDFHFKSGETLPDLRIHYATFGAPVRDANGRVTNAVLLLHGTTGSGRQFLAPQFAGVLFGPGQLLDVTRYYVILPDNIGHGKSSKPSDGMHAHFPQYDYDDMVLSQHEMLEKGLDVNHLRLILGTSMGCMHAWVWGETYPDFMDALMPLACQPVADRGAESNLAKDGDGCRSRRSRLEERRIYFSALGCAENRCGDVLYGRGSALQMQKSFPTRDATDAAMRDYREAIWRGARCQRSALRVGCFAEL